MGLGLEDRMLILDGLLLESMVGLLSLMAMRIMLTMVLINFNMLMILQYLSGLMFMVRQEILNLPFRPGEVDHLFLFYLT